MARGNLTPEQAEIVRAVTLLQEDGRASDTAVASTLGIEVAAVRRSFGALERGGWLDVARSPDGSYDAQLTPDAMGAAPD